MSAAVAADVGLEHGCLRAAVTVQLLLTHQEEGRPAAFAMPPQIMPSMMAAPDGGMNWS